jgi:hypothetical protein
MEPKETRLTDSNVTDLTAPMPMSEKRLAHAVSTKNGRSHKKRAEKSSRPEGAPDAFLDKFTSHPVVDEVMKRLSK